MKLIAVALVVAMAGCGKSDSKQAGADDDKAAPPAQAGDEGNSKKRGPKKRERAVKWTVQYKGDLTGEVSGSILVAIGRNVNGGALTADRKGKAPQAIQVTMVDDPAGGTGIKALTTLTLADGTKCIDVVDDDKAPSVAAVINGEPKEYAAHIRGTLTCGDDKKKISYKARLNKQKKR